MQGEVRWALQRVEMVSSLPASSVSFLTPLFSPSDVSIGLMEDVNPIMVADLSWERYDAVMTPCVIELENDVLRMYYSAGEAYEPDAIGVAHSYDGGATWVKHGDPVFYPDPESASDNFKVTSPHMIVRDGWYYLFYCGFKGFLPLLLTSFVPLHRSGCSFQIWTTLQSTSLDQEMV